MATDKTVTEAGQALNISTQFVYVLLRNRKLEGRKQDGRWLISASSIENRKQRIKERLTNP